MKWTVSSGAGDGELDVGGGGVEETEVSLGWMTVVCGEGIDVVVCVWIGGVIDEQADRSMDAMTTTMIVASRTRFIAQV